MCDYRQWHVSHLQEDSANIRAKYHGNMSIIAYSTEVSRFHQVMWSRFCQLPHFSPIFLHPSCSIFSRGIISIQTETWNSQGLESPLPAAKPQDWYTFEAINRHVFPGEVRMSYCNHDSLLLVNYNRSRDSSETKTVAEIAHQGHWTDYRRQLSGTNHQPGNWLIATGGLLDYLISSKPTSTLR